MNASAFRAQNLSDDVSFRADVVTLNGTLFRPAGPPRAAAVLHGATGVPARFYRHFARWLAAQGIACLTYDYRDFAGSSSGSLRRSQATLARWGLGDQPAAQAALEREYPGVPVWVIGHSLGALMVPFHPRAHAISRLISVASGPVHTSDHPLRIQAQVRAFWFGLGPLATAMLGYLPGKALGLGADLPAGVYWQWRRWCTTQGFYLGDIGRDLPMPDWNAFRGDMRVVAVSDDGMVPPSAVWRLMQHYPEARKQQKVIHRTSGRIGHVSLFAERNRSLWPDIIAEA